MSERRIEIVYCDDIRVEVGGKSSLMGIYLGDLFVNEMPVTLPKLCVWMNVVTPANQPFTKLRMRVMHDGIELLDTLDLCDQDRPLTFGGDDDLPSTNDSFFAVNMAITLSPFQIDGEGILQVVAETDSGELKSRRLRIRKGPPPQPQ